jgi:hypothetical protein
MASHCRGPHGMSTVLLSRDVLRSDTDGNPSRKRKRPESTKEALHSTADLLPKLTPESSFSSTAEDQITMSTPPNPALGIHCTDGVSGAMSPRMHAAGEFSRLSIVEGINNDEGRRKDVGVAGITKREKTPENLRKSTAAEDENEDESGQPAAKKVPRGIRSPRPKFKRIGLVVPEKTESTSEPSSDADASIDFWDFDFSSMTWQDDEITGHLMLDSDDDGTGINGIGFRPTPSIARQRAAQRRKQVQDWKVRQDMEERERRAERRRMQSATFATSQELGGVKKAVRFSV